MEKIDQFKTFVQRKPELISHVNNGNTTWQKLYETWDLYGENHDVWKNYANSTTTATATAAAATAGTFGLKEIIGSIRSVNMDSVVKGLDGLQRVLGTLRDFTGKEGSSTTSEPYIPRPVHKYFDD